MLIEGMEGMEGMPMGMGVGPALSTGYKTQNRSKPQTPKLLGVFLVS